jgi:hypothetical protein
MAVAIALAAATPLAAQSAKASRCPAIDTTARWYVKQRAWADDSRHAWSNDSLRTALVHAAALDAHPDAGAGALLGYEIVGAAPNAPSSDAASAIAMLRALAQNRQATWPTKSVVGAAGVRAVWTLASQDTALARVALHRMMEAGPEESPPAAVAILEDRLRIASGRKQIYGTQLVKAADGKLEPAPLEDAKHVDLRRDAAGLPPLAQSICAAVVIPSERQRVEGSTVRNP